MVIRTGGRLRLNGTHYMDVALLSRALTRDLRALWRDSRWQARLPLVVQARLGKGALERIGTGEVGTNQTVEGARSCVPRGAGRGQAAQGVCPGSDRARDRGRVAQGICRNYRLGSRCHHPDAAVTIRGRRRLNRDRHLLASRIAGPRYDRSWPRCVMLHGIGDVRYKWLHAPWTPINWASLSRGGRHRPGKVRVGPLSKEKLTEGF